jgi:sugar phosphate isomerase/epimerase
MKLSRRNVLKLGAGGAILWTAGVRPASLRAEYAEKIPIGLQLFSVRDVIGKDMAGTLQAVADMGYQGVEFAGYYNRKAEDLRQMLGRAGLKCCGTHIELKTLLGDAFKETVEFHQTVGMKNIAIHGLPPEHLVSLATILDAAKLLTEISEKLEAVGIRFSYHTQARDVKRVEGQIPIQAVFAHAGPKLHMQVDTGNCMEGGADPIGLLKKFPGRSLSVHLSEHDGPQHAVIGEGDVKWKDVFDVCEAAGNHIEWYVVEQVTFRDSPLESARRCLENLRKMGK